MSAFSPPAQEIGGYVLAGGQSSRMGQDKALLELGGRPLVQQAVEKLQEICKDVRVLSGRQDLAAFAPLVGDVHPGCGPLAGMEAALMHSTFAWNLILAVDMPFLPSGFVNDWVSQSLLDSAGQGRGVRVRMFEADGHPQPGLCLVHRDLRPHLTASLERGEYRILPALAAAGRELATQSGLLPSSGLWKVPVSEFLATRESVPSGRRSAKTDADGTPVHLWFANLNTPAQFAEAARYVNDGTLIRRAHPIG